MSEPTSAVWYESDPPRLVQERDAMQARFQQFRLRRSGRTLYWDGHLTSNSGETYRIVIRYPDNFPDLPPKVFPIEPDILTLHNEATRELKHQFSDGSLCLFHPHDRFFERRSTAVTVIAAAATWFAAYEYWLYSEKTIWPGREAD
ncbi:hypothetical protein EKD04_015740 [Chloroflexales bacterium ZM16-3]|nr:hypothetical protein [Chloroflexales bacterium ZM16-3]